MWWLTSGLWFSYSTIESCWGITICFSEGGILLSIFQCFFFCNPLTTVISPCCAFGSCNWCIRGYWESFCLSGSYNISQLDPPTFDSVLTLPVYVDESKIQMKFQYTIGSVCILKPTFEWLWSPNDGQ